MIADAYTSWFDRCWAADIYRDLSLFVSLAKQDDVLSNQGVDSYSRSSRITI